MALLLPELKDRLAQRFDVVTLLELLDVTSEELLEAFQDRVSDRMEYLESQLEDEDFGETTEV